MVIAFWVVLIIVAAAILRAAVVWLGEVIEDGWEEWDNDGAAWKRAHLNDLNEKADAYRYSSAPSDSVKPTAKGSAKS